jgi:hypothetical protein
MPKEKEDPWHDLEIEVDVALRNLATLREQCHEHVVGDNPVTPSKSAAGGDGDGGAAPSPGRGHARVASKDWGLLHILALQKIEKVLMEMHEACGAVGEDVDMMDAVNAAALDHPERFAIATGELQRRQDVSQSARRRLAKARGDLAVDERRCEARLVKLRPRAGSPHQFDRPGGGNAGTLTDPSLVQEEQTQKDLNAQQDAALDRIIVGVDAAHEKAKAIGTEMDQQDVLLRDAEHDINAVQVKMESGMKRIGALLDRTSDRGKIITIIVLLVVLTLLSILMFTDDKSSRQTQTRS